MCRTYRKVYTIILAIVAMIVNCQDCFNFVEIENSEISQYNWDAAFSIKEQLDYILKMQRPVKIVGAPLNNWTAFSNWMGPGYLEKNIPTFIDVRSKPSGIPFINEEFSDPYKIAKQNGIFQEPSEILFNMTSIEFLNTNISSRYYARDLFENDLASIISDLQPIDFLDIKQVDEDPGIFLWMAHKGTRAVAHYDTAHNFNVQILGKKRFWLSPPNNWDRMNIYPSFHLSRRQSQLTDYSIFNHSVILEPKQILYIPPYYFHAVEALDFCANVNVFSISDIRMIEKEIIQPKYVHPNILDQILEATRSMWLQSVAYLIINVIKKIMTSKVLCETQMIHNNPFLIFDIIVHQRYKPIPLLCDDFDATRCPRGLSMGPITEYKMELDQIAETLSHIVMMRKTCWNKGVLELLFSDWVEATLIMSVGIKNSCIFLRCIINSLNTR